ncbi:hypothetical protein V4R08_12005 [Nitrobacter sp. NHB1]|uniref:hypothetical protein n=1 Tax=Nitrobacter sp. NHB1 TaxID=3119830 RepID=UPI00300095D9
MMDKLLDPQGARREQGGHPTRRGARDEKIWRRRSGTGRCGSGGQPIAPGSGSNFRIATSGDVAAARSIG